MKLLSAVAAGLVFAGGIRAEEENAQRAIRDRYREVLAAMRTIRTQAEREQLVGGMDVPEWTATMPAGEPLTRESVLREGAMALGIPPEKRSIPQMDIAYMAETGWSVLVVYWRYREEGAKALGALYRDTWIRTAPGWRRVHMEKFFPDRVPADGEKAVFSPRR
jgi:hypothetical protein